VYNAYQKSGAIHGNKALNPASFGKLVRIIFPSVQTRRLGNRGNSRYHYCGLAVQGHLLSRESSVEPEDHSNKPYPSIPPPFNENRPVSPNESVHMSRSVSPVRERTDPQDSDEITLPKLSRFVPKGTEKEFVQSLQFLFQSHYSLLKKYLRHMQLENFFDLFKQLYGLMTLPVRRLLENPQVTEWIKLCDTTFYEHMIRLMSHLAWQVLPPSVIDGLKQIRNKLVPAIEAAFKPYPPHVLAVKIQMATKFSRLFDQLIRLNHTADAVTPALQTLANSNPVYRDWGNFIEPMSTLRFQEPSCDHLGSLEQVYGRMLQLLLRDETVESAESILDPWIAMLMDLPSIFPGVAWNTIKTCMGDLTQAISSELLSRPLGQSVYLDWARIQMLIVEWVRFEAEQADLSSQLAMPYEEAMVEQ
jgi:regulatory factor X